MENFNANPKNIMMCLRIIVFGDLNAFYAFNYLAAVVEEYVCKIISKTETTEKCCLNFLLQL